MDKEVKKVYILTQSVLNGTVTMNVYCSVFATKELAEKTKEAVIEANENTKSQTPSFHVFVDIQESYLYETEEDVPILNEEKYE